MRLAPPAQSSRTLHTFSSFKMYIHIKKVRVILAVKQNSLVRVPKIYFLFDFTADSLTWYFTVFCQFTAQPQFGFTTYVRICKILTKPQTLTFTQFQTSVRRYSYLVYRLVRQGCYKTSAWKEHFELMRHSIYSKRMSKPNSCSRINNLTSQSRLIDPFFHYTGERMLSNESSGEWEISVNFNFLNC